MCRTCRGNINLHQIFLTFLFSTLYIIHAVLSAIVGGRTESGRPDQSAAAVPGGDGDSKFKTTDRHISDGRCFVKCGVHAIHPVTLSAAHTSTLPDGCGGNFGTRIRIPENKRPSFCHFQCDSRAHPRINSN